MDLACIDYAIASNLCTYSIYHAVGGIASVFSASATVVPIARD